MKSNLTTASRSALALTTAMLLALAVSGAHANEQLRSETVKFQDLNTDTPAGVQALYDRIHSAATRVCSESDALQQIAAKACARKAEARAVGQLSLPQLTAYFQMKTGAPLQQLTANR
jgi:UrcA family protein